MTGMQNMRDRHNIEIHTTIITIIIIKQEIYGDTGNIGVDTQC